MAAIVTRKTWELDVTRPSNWFLLHITPLQVNFTPDFNDHSTRVWPGVVLFHLRPHPELHSTTQPFAATD